VLQRFNVGGPDGEGSLEASRRGLERDSRNGEERQPYDCLPEATRSIEETESQRDLGALGDRNENERDCL
jgi:hypothetical protein